MELGDAAVVIYIVFRVIRLASLLKCFQETLGFDSDQDLTNKLSSSNDRTTDSNSSISTEELKMV